MSHWVAWTDAISLSRVLPNGRAAAALAAPSRQPAAAPAVIELGQRVRKDLTDAISGDATLLGDTLTRVHVGRGAAAGERVDYAAYRRNYRAHQHTMEDRIAELRRQVRATASRLGPQLGELAALDAVFDAAMSAHQRRLLENVPVLLEKHFQAQHMLLQENTTRQVGPDTPVLRTLPADIGQTLQRALLAELAIRLLPVEGMIEAFGMNPIGQA